MMKKAFLAKTAIKSSSSEAKKAIIKKANIANVYMGKKIDNLRSNISNLNKSRQLSKHKDDMHKQEAEKVRAQEAEKIRAQEAEKIRAQEAEKINAAKVRAQEAAKVKAQEAAKVKAQEAAKVKAQEAAKAQKKQDRSTIQKIEGIINVLDNKERKIGYCIDFDNVITMRNYFYFINNITPFSLKNGTVKIKNLRKKIAFNCELV